MNEVIINESDIQNKIYTIRDKQVMLDSDLASLYQVETKQLNKAVNRNLKRFPEHFRFQLTQDEYDDLRYQNGTSSQNANQHGGRRYLPYAFTEQGVSMLSAVLRSDIAIEMSIKIIDAFVTMRRMIASNLPMFERFERIEQRLSIHDENFNTIFKALEEKTRHPKQGIFYNGQIFDSYEFVAKLIKSAKHSIILIDNYIDESVLTLFSKNQAIDVTIYTHSISKQLKLDLQKYNAQYRPITVKPFKDAHDRFMILDENDVYHIGASLKDLGKKWFAFSRMNVESFGIMERLQ
ncbi:MAG: ORF6N domain-containing protein [Sulfurovum sp.]|nr:ORF6N domain-containing protein [Sulfurovum sp.]